MKILHVVTAFDVDFPGGITIYVKNLATSQAALGHTVLVVDGSTPTPPRMEPGGYERFGHEAAQGSRFVPAVKELRRRSQSLISAIREVRADLVHFHLTEGLGLEFYREFPDEDVPYIVSLHDYHLFCPRVTMFDFKGENCGGPSRSKCENCIGVLDQNALLFRSARRVNAQLPRWPSSKVTRRNEVIAEFMKGADGLHAVSERVRELFCDVYPEGQYFVSHIGSASAGATRGHRTTSSRLRLTFLGTLSPPKGSEILERLARGIVRSDIEINFYGRCFDSDLEEQVKSAGVILRGSYSPSALPEILANTDVGLALPIWEDNGPQVVMEFNNYGVPVIATSMGGIPDFVIPPNGYLFDPFRDEEIAGAIAFIETLTIEAAAKMAENLPSLKSPDEHAREIIGRYSKVLCARHRRAAR